MNLMIDILSEKDPWSIRCIYQKDPFEILFDVLSTPWTRYREGFIIHITSKYLHMDKFPYQCMCF